MRPTARAIAASVRAGADPVAIALAAADRAEADPFNSVRHVDRRAVAAAAAAIDRTAPLAGVPVALKDNFCDRGQPCGCASRALEGYIAPYDATVVSRLRAAGAVVIARTNMDEFAMGSSTEHSAYGPTRNPHDPTRSPGGSSGGSAAAVAAGITPLALGSDSGGSARQPGSLCGIVAFKPTYGLLSRSGLVAFASSLDTVAPMGADVRDVALLTAVLAGPDPADATSLDAPLPDLLAACDGGVRGLRVGVLAETTAVDVEPGVADALAAVAAALRAAGAETLTVSVPSLTDALSAYQALAAAEASSNLARYDGIRYGHHVGATDLRSQYTRTRTDSFGPEVKRRILLGTFLLSADGATSAHVAAQAHRHRVRAALASLFTSVDLLLTPTSGTVAFPLGDRSGDPASMYRSDLFTVHASLAGLPAISVPCGTVRGLPVGAQLIGRRLGEATVLAAAAVVEAAFR